MLTSDHPVHSHCRSGIRSLRIWQGSSWWGSVFCSAVVPALGSCMVALVATGQGTPVMLHCGGTAVVIDVSDIRAMMSYCVCCSAQVQAGQHTDAMFGPPDRCAVHCCNMWVHIYAPRQWVLHANTAEECQQHQLLAGVQQHELLC
jgi:hypothetical protein